MCFQVRSPQGGGNNNGIQGCAADLGMVFSTFGISLGCRFSIELGGKLKKNQVQLEFYASLSLNQAICIK